MDKTQVVYATTQEGKDWSLWEVKEGILTEEEIRSTIKTLKEFTDEKIKLYKSNRYSH